MGCAHTNTRGKMAEARRETGFALHVLAYIEDGFRFGRQALLDVRLEPPEHERPEDLVQLVDDVLLGLLVVDLKVEPLDTDVSFGSCVPCSAVQDTTRDTGSRTTREIRPESWGEVRLLVLRVTRST